MIRHISGIYSAESCWVEFEINNHYFDRMIIDDKQDAGKWAIILDEILVVTHFIQSLSYKVIFAACYMWQIIYCWGFNWCLLLYFLSLFVGCCLIWSANYYHPISYLNLHWLINYKIEWGGNKIWLLCLNVTSTIIFMFAYQTKKWLRSHARECDMGSLNRDSIGPNETAELKFIWAGFNAMQAESGSVSWDLRCSFLSAFLISSWCGRPNLLLLAHRPPSIESTCLFNQINFMLSI